MNNYYKDKIKVVCVDLQCFPVDPKTLEATSCSTYDPWAIKDPDPEPLETISADEWYMRINKKEDDRRKAYYEQYMCDPMSAQREEKRKDEG